MSKEKKPLAALKVATNIVTKPITVVLGAILMVAERFCYRDPAALQSDALKSLMDSLILEKLQEPIEGYFDKDGRFILVKGYRRVAALHELARKNTPGFTLDMEVEALLLENGTYQDLLVRSVSGNGVRVNLTRAERIIAAKRMYDGGVEEARAAAALGVSVKTYQRDLLIAKHGWMFEHVIDNNIDATAAIALLEAGEKHKCVAAIKEDFAAWVAQKKHLIREREQLRKLKGAKELSPAEKQVKSQLPRHLLDHWLELIEQGKRFDDDAEWEFVAGIDAETGQLHVGTVTLDLDKDSPEKIGKVAAKLSLMAKQIVPHLKKRLLTVPAKEAMQDQLYDWDYLKEAGAGDMAARLQARSERSKAQGDKTLVPDMEDAFGEVESQDEEPAAEEPAEQLDQEELNPQADVESAEEEQSSSVS